MAKSLRSKWRRKCRAVKRERYGEKELTRLKKTLGIDENATTETDMQEISEIATVTDAKTIKAKADKAEKEKGDDGDNQDKMEVEGARVFNRRTMRDQHGNYPIWMSHRKITKHKHARTKGRNMPTRQTKKKPKKLRNKAKK